MYRCKIGGVDFQPLSGTFKGIHTPLHKFLVKFIPGHGIVQAVARLRRVVLLQHMAQMAGMGIVPKSVAPVQDIQISAEKNTGAFRPVLLQKSLKTFSAGFIKIIINDHRAVSL